MTLFFFGGQRNLRRVECAIFGRAGSVHDPDPFLNHADKVAVYLGRVRLIDLSLQPVGAFERMLRKQLGCDRPATRVQGTLKVPVEVSFQTKVDRYAKNQQSAGEESRVPGRDAETERSGIHERAPLLMP